MELSESDKHLIDSFAFRCVSLGTVPRNQREVKNLIEGVNKVNLFYERLETLPVENRLNYIVKNKEYYESYIRTGGIFSEERDLLFTDKFDFQRRFYSSNLWIAVSIKALRRDGFKCKLDFEGCKQSANTVHHIRAAYENPQFCLDLNNLISCCKSCHEKTRPS